MIEGFEKETHELNEAERALIPFFTYELRLRKGESNAITNKQLIELIKNRQPNASLSGPRVRKIINYIRINGLVRLLCANSKGYFVAVKHKEIEDYLKGLDQRINEQQRVSNSLKNQYQDVLNELNEQNPIHQAS